jgi:hypothetical protein
MTMSKRRHFTQNYHSLKFLVESNLTLKIKSNQMGKYYFINSQPAQQTLTNILEHRLVLHKLFLTLLIDKSVSWIDKMSTSIFTK